MKLRKRKNKPHSKNNKKEKKDPGAKQRETGQPTIFKWVVRGSEVHEREKEKHLPVVPGREGDTSTRVLLLHSCQQHDLLNLSCLCCRDSQSKGTREMVEDKASEGLVPPARVAESGASHRNAHDPAVSPAVPVELSQARAASSGASTRGDQELASSPLVPVEMTASDTEKDNLHSTDRLNTIFC